MKRALAMLLLLCLLFPAAALAADDGADGYVDNWYEIFVYSFADGDGDRIGDFRGATEKLEYVKDMGFGGIWLMPIHPSPSYHKYDVTDYYAVDPLYGTLEDFQAFLDRAHALGIRVIIDLVVNHTSNEHPWFQSAMADESSPYRDYYRFSREARAGYNPLPDGWYFESRFVSTMPDLNLDNPAVREEIASVMRYWLEMGVDGFRLDAVTSYYTGDKSANIAFLRWLNETAKSIRPDCFLVGECWDSLYTIADYYDSGLDSFFTFPVAQGGGYIASILGKDVQKKGESLGNVVELLQRELGDVWLSPFLGNHDTVRIAQALGYHTPTAIKMAAGLLAMMNGSVFVYYGDEIGMIGAENDPQKRLGMFWDERKNITFCPPGARMLEYPFPSVRDQQEQPSSILNYYRQAMALRNRFPHIARGVPTVLESPDVNVCLLEKAWNGETLLIAVNLSVDDMTFAVPEGYDTLVGELEVWGEAVLEGDALTVPAYGIALLQ